MIFVLIVGMIILTKFPKKRVFEYAIFGIQKLYINNFVRRHKNFGYLKFKGVLTQQRHII